MLEILLSLKHHFLEVKNKLTHHFENNTLFYITSIFRIYNRYFSQTARLKGVILDENNNPVEKVNITAGTTKTLTNSAGFYSLNVPANIKVTVTFSHLGFKTTTLVLELKSNEDFELNPVMSNKTEEMGEVVVVNNRKRVQGITVIEPEIIRRIPGANAGIENILKTLPGVNMNNELSTQYSVRGGNYDENLVYVTKLKFTVPF